MSFALLFALLVVLTAGQGLNVVTYSYTFMLNEACAGEPTSASFVSYTDVVPCFAYSNPALPGSTSYECVNGTSYVTNSYDSADCTGPLKVGYPIIAAGDGSCPNNGFQRIYCDNSSLITPSGWSTFESVSYSDDTCETIYSTTVFASPPTPVAPVTPTPVNPCVRISDEQSYIPVSCDATTVTRDYYGNENCTGEPTLNRTSSCTASPSFAGRYAVGFCANPVTPTPPTPPVSPPVDPPTSGAPTSGTPTSPPTSGTPTSPPTSGTPTSPPTSGTPTSPPTSGTPTTPTPSGSFGSRLAFSFVLVAFAIFGLMF